MELQNYMPQNGYNNMMKAARGWAVCIVDGIEPMGNCGTPRIGNASEDWQRLR